ncbi:MAG TPA: DUF4493 domain-containing protein [Candidatus Coprenecus pullicola]|nr:DUF4493 domain-containing protein [Candidatus Coprenecus pullicola]
MKKTILALTVAAFTALTAGCNKEGVSYSGDKAQLTLFLTATGSFVEVSPVSKSEETADVNEFAINIVDVASGRTVYSWDRYADMPGTVSLDPAVYRVEAGSSVKQPVAWNQPVFFGSQEVTVEAGSTAQVSVVCTIANMKVSVRCTDSFLAEVETDFTVTVTTEDGPLIFTKDRIDAGDAGYFDVAPLTMDLYAVRKSGGTVTHHMEISEVAARDHHIFTLDAGGTGYADFSNGISIDYACNEKEEHIIIDGTDEPDTPGAAVTITATAGIDAPVTYNKSELPSEFNLTVSAPAGIEKYEVNILSAGLRGLLDMMQMDYSVDLANMSATEEGFWGSLFGITSDDVKGQTDVVFQIGAFLAAMPAETNELQVVITDKNGETATAALTIIMTE